MNDQLHAALANARVLASDLAEHLGVDPKTVERWLHGRMPYPRHRWAVADFLRVQEEELWPEADRGRRTMASDVVGVYAHRWEVPHAVWRDLFSRAEQQIDILTYSGLFLAEDAGLLRIIRQRVEEGARLRVLLGDPDSAQAQTRSRDEGLGADIMAARIRNAHALLKPFQDLEGAEVRAHGTVLYNSIYRADDTLLVNTHAYGTPAPQAPVMRLHRTEADGAAAMYLTSFERVWELAESLRQ